MRRSCGAGCELRSAVAAQAEAQNNQYAQILLGYLARIMKNRLDEENRRDGESGLVDRKLRRQIEEKKVVHGQRMG